MATYLKEIASSMWTNKQLSLQLYYLLLDKPFGEIEKIEES